MKRILFLILCILLCYNITVADQYIYDFTEIPNTTVNQFTNINLNPAYKGISYIGISRDGLSMFFGGIERELGSGTCFNDEDDICSCEETVVNEQSKIYKATRASIADAASWATDETVEINGSGSYTKGFSVGKWNDDVNIVIAEEFSIYDKLYLITESGDVYSESEDAFAGINTYIEATCTAADISYPYFSYDAQYIIFNLSCTPLATSPNGLMYSYCENWNGAEDRCTSYSDPVTYLGRVDSDTEISLDVLTNTSETYFSNLSHTISNANHPIFSLDASRLLFPIVKDQTDDRLFLDITNDGVTTVDLGSNEYTLVKGELNGVWDYTHNDMYYEGDRRCLGGIDIWVDQNTWNQYIYASSNREVWFGKLETVASTSECYGSDISCEDGYFCNGYEQCYDTLSYTGTTEERLWLCQKGINKTPCGDDGIYCDGVVTCNESFDRCDHAEGLCPTSWCDGNQCCLEPTDSCLQDEPAVDCDDSSECTLDECSNSLEMCINTCIADDPEDECCEDPVCSDYDLCGELVSVCTDAGFIWFEDFEDQDIDQPDIGTVYTFTNSFNEATEDVDFTIAAGGNTIYGYMFDPIENGEAHVFWALNATEWDTDIFYTKFSAQIANLDDNDDYDEDIILFDMKWNDQTDGIRFYMKDEFNIGYEVIENGSSIEIGNIYSHTVPTETYDYEIYVNFASGVIKVFIDHELKKILSYGINQWENKEVDYVSFLGPDLGMRDTFDTNLDEINVWTSLPSNFECSHDNFCNDGLYCNGNEECDDITSLCVAGSNPCTDIVDCTVDTCDEATYTCTNTISNTACDDSNSCTTDTCNAYTGCSYECNVLYPNDPCCTDSECLLDGNCTGEAGIVVYEDFNDEEIDPPLYVLGDTDRNLLDLGEYTLGTGYGGTGYALEAGTYGTPFIRYIYDMYKGDTTLWPTDELFISYRLKFPSMDKRFRMELGLLQIKWHADNILGSATFTYSIPDIDPSASIITYGFNAPSSEHMGSGELDISDYTIDDEEWHLFEYYFKFASNSQNEVKMWIDNTLILDGAYSQGAWDKDIYYMYIPGFDDADRADTLERSIDNIEIWTGIPGGDSDCDDDDDCDDSNTCTTSYCIRNVCYTEYESGSCDDEDACTMTDVCSSGSCAGVTLDSDGDGYTTYACGGIDCDDSNAARYDDNTEICDGIDNDCDGSIPYDELDVDEDGYAECEDDCDDNDENVSPGITEGPYEDATCSDDLDNDCDGSIDEDDSNCDECAVSSDCTDGNACTSEYCLNGACISYNNTLECNDGVICTEDDVCSDGVCSGTPLDYDNDGFVDGDCGGTDCHDSNSNINPSVIEGPYGDSTCSDGFDNDCDLYIDALDDGCTILVPIHRIIIIGN